MAHPNFVKSEGFGESCHPSHLRGRSVTRRLAVGLEADGHRAVPLLSMWRHVTFHPLPKSWIGINSIEIRVHTAPRKRGNSELLDNVIQTPQLTAIKRVVYMLQCLTYLFFKLTDSH